MDFYSDSRPRKINMFVLHEIHRAGFDPEYSDVALGRLVMEFNAKFHYNCFLWTPMANDLRGQVKICAIPRETDVSPGSSEKDRIVREDELRMVAFVQGFLAAAKNRAKEKANRRR